jgi:hypothetical protein
MTSASHDLIGISSMTKAQALKTPAPNERQNRGQRIEVLYLEQLYSHVTPWHDKEEKGQCREKSLKENWCLLS